MPVNTASSAKWKMPYTSPRKMITLSRFSSLRRSRQRAMPSPPSSAVLTLGVVAVSCVDVVGVVADLACHKRPLPPRSEEHTSELQSRGHLVCRLLLEKKNDTNK